MRQQKQDLEVLFCPFILRLPFTAEAEREGHPSEERNTLQRIWTVLFLCPFQGEGWDAENGLKFVYCCDRLLESKLGFCHQEVRSKEQSF